MRKKVSKKLQTFSLLVAGTSIFAACGQALPERAELKLTNGIEAENDAFPAVVLFVMPSPSGQRICTGVFVNEHQALTAAHCVHELDLNNPELYLARSGDTKNEAQTFDYSGKALRITLHTDYEKGRDQVANPSDLAIVDFAAGTAPDVLHLAHKTPRPNDQITLIGFGSSENNESGLRTQVGKDAGIKRYGRNSIQSLSNGIIRLSGVNKSRNNLQKGQYVATSAGDSGSPLLYNGELVAMTVAGEVRRGGAGQVVSYSYSIDLTSPANQAFLSSALD